MEPSLLKTSSALYKFLTRYSGTIKSINIFIWLLVNGGGNEGDGFHIKSILKKKKKINLNSIFKLNIAESIILQLNTIPMIKKQYSNW